MDAEIAEQLARRDRYRRHQWSLLTWEQRVAEMMRQQQTSWDLLRLNPATYDRWYRQSWSARAAPRREVSDNAA